MTENFKNTYKIFFDGACSNNGKNGKMGIGVVIYENKEIYAEIYSFNGRGTNNRAEYEALIEGIKFIRGEIKKKRISLKDSQFIFYGDSKLVIKQVTGEWKTNDEILSTYKDEVLQLKNFFDKKQIKFKHIRREFNQEADELSKKGLSLEKKSR